MKIYQTHGDPFRDEDGVWRISIMWLDEETGNMGRGMAILPGEYHGYELQRRFQRDITPMGQDDVERFYETVTKGAIH